MQDYDKHDAIGLADLVRNREVSATELLDEALARADQAQAELNCFSALFPDAARKQIEDGVGEGPFAGVPFATKDLGVHIEGLPITSGSRAFKGTIAKTDSEIVRRYRKAGLVLFGQTTSPEFGLTTSTESALYGQTRNPWNLTRTSGGSSGGASATVASGVIPMAQASDGGGSIRIPAACTGLVGMKPSRGRIPLGPPKSESWNGLSTVHCVSRSVRDSASLMDATHGREPGSRYTAAPTVTSFYAASQRAPRRLKVAMWTTAPNGTRPDADAQAGLDATVTLLTSLGHVVEDAGPNIDGEAIGKGMVMVISAAMANIAAEREATLGRAIGEDDFEPVSLRYIEMGRKIPIVELAAADEAFMRASYEWDGFLSEGGYDLVLMPTLSRAPVELGVLGLNPDDIDAYNHAVSTFAPWCGLFNMIGCPAISLPLHWTPDGLPLGMMFAAPHGDEALLYSLAGELERAAPWAHRRAGFYTG